MRDIDRAQRLLGLFTSADCAEAIAGDLIEERRSRGVLWFWRHVVGNRAHRFAKRGDRRRPCRL